jgi:hypothetical protein
MTRLTSARPSTGTRAAANIAVALVSLFVAGLLCEGLGRLVLNPANYLSVRTVKDDVLGIRIPGGSAGFDAWGFRNAAVPGQVDVLALGDSHTFGNTARMQDAWPSVVASDTGLTTYNMGLGGYGPVQYFQLLTSRGLGLHPNWVLCGLYMGDDFENAFSMSYGLEHWAYLRDGNFGPVDANIWGTAEAPGWSKSVRNWLSEHSLIYRLTVHGPLLAQAKANVEFQRASRGEDPATTVLEVPEQHIREAFRPAPIAMRLDQQSPAVREGMRITFRLLRDMNDACRKQGCRFGVVVIPTKEHVFAPYFQGRSLHLQEQAEKVIANERLARTALFAALASAGIPYVDTLEPLRRGAGNQLYAATTNDMHPGRNGYKVIGDAAAAFLEQQRASAGK